MDEATDGLAEISQWSTNFSATTNNVAAYIIAAMLAVALIPMIWAVATNKSDARTYVLAWFVALIFALVFVLK